jgi:acetoin utilization deacetylase AcuC-like enzyme
VKEKSDLDIGLDFNVGDDEYLGKLASAMEKIFNDFQPGFVIYLAGADPYMFDQLGNLKLTIDGLIKRDEMVITYTHKNRLPMIVVLGGGYAQELEDTVEIHCNTARIMQRIYAN